MPYFDTLWVISYNNQTMSELKTPSSFIPKTYSEIQAIRDVTAPGQRPKALGLIHADLNLVAQHEGGFVAWQRLPSNETVEYSFIPMESEGDCSRSYFNGHEVAIRSRGFTPIPKHAIPVKLIDINCSDMEEAYQPAKEFEGSFRCAEGWAFGEKNNPDTLLLVHITSDSDAYYPSKSTYISPSVQALPGIEWLSKQKATPQKYTTSLEDLYYTPTDLTVSEILSERTAPLDERRINQVVTSKHGTATFSQLPPYEKNNATPHLVPNHKVPTRLPEPGEATPVTFKDTILLPTCFTPSEMDGYPEIKFLSSDFKKQFSIFTYQDSSTLHREGIMRLEDAMPHTRIKPTEIELF